MCRHSFPPETFTSSMYTVHPFRSLTFFTFMLLLNNLNLCIRSFSSSTDVKVELSHSLFCLLSSWTPETLLVTQPLTVSRYENCGHCSLLGQFPVPGFQFLETCRFWEFVFRILTIRSKGDTWFWLGGVKENFINYCNLKGLIFLLYVTSFFLFTFFLMYMKKTRLY